MTAPAVTREQVRLALESATRDLPAHERVAAAERLARELARRRRRTRYPSPGALAQAIDPLASVETPALRLVDAAVLRAERQPAVGPRRRRAGTTAPPRTGSPGAELTRPRRDDDVGGSSRDGACWSA